MRNFYKKESFSDYVMAGCVVTILAIILFVGLCFLFSAIGVWLWGAIMVPVFGLPALTYWQMFGIIVLARIIFGSKGYSVSLSK